MLRQKRMSRAECPIAGMCKREECMWETGGECIATAMARQMGIEPLPAAAGGMEAT